VLSRLLIAVSSAAVLGLSACSQGGGEPASTPPPEQSAPETQQTDSGVQPVEVQNPLDVKAFGEDPCRLLKPEQVAALGITAEPDTADVFAGVSCVWEDDAASVEMSVDLTGRGGYARVRAGADEAYENFEEIDTLGYPAARANVFGEENCNLVVGVSEQDVLLISTDKFISDDPQHQDQCAFAEKVFHEAVKNIPPQN
jgi:hypothetical protein